MKNIKRIGILALICILLFSVMSVSVFAEGEVDTSAPVEVDTTAEIVLKDVDGGDLSLPERLEYALQGTATGLVMVFAVLALLAIVVGLSKVILHDLPRKARESAAAEARAEEEKETEIAAQSAPAAAPAPVAPVAQADDGELVAVITAAVAAAIASGDYGSEFASGFRVVSFKRTNTNTWNKR